MGEIGGLIGKGPLVTFDQRHVTVHLDASKGQALSGLDASSSSAHLESRLAALSGETVPDERLATLEGRRETAVPPPAESGD